MRPQNGARYRQVLLCRGDRSLRLDSSVKLYWQNLLFMCGTHHNFILNGSVFKIVSTWKHIDALEIVPYQNRLHRDVLCYKIHFSYHSDPTIENMKSCMHIMSSLFCFKNIYFNIVSRMFKSG